MSERRTDLLDRRVNPALNMFLTTEPGLESGFMIAHVAAAALTSENRTLAHPASVDNVTTSAGQEDHVSMAPWAGFKLRRDLRRTLRRCSRSKLLAAAHAIDKLQPLATTEPLQQVHALVRRKWPVPAVRSSPRPRHRGADDADRRGSCAFVKRTSRCQTRDRNARFRDRWPAATAAHLMPSTPSSSSSRSSACCCWRSRVSDCFARVFSLRRAAR